MTSAEEDLGMAVFECRDCAMTFASAERLANHKNKFCVNSDFADPEKLLERLRREENANGGAFVTFGDVTDYIQSGYDDGSNIGQMNLGDLRVKFQDSDYEMQQMQKQILKQRKREQVEGLRDLKVEQAKLRAAKEKEQSELLQKLKDMEHIKQEEMRARMERERARRELAGIDKKRLAFLEKEKQRELDALAAERSKLQAKEEAILKEVAELETRVNRQSQLQKERDSQLDEVMGYSTQAEDLETKKKTVMEKTNVHAAARGKGSAVAQQRHDSLLAEKAKLEARLVEITSGRTAEAKEVEDLDTFIQSVSTNQNAKAEKIDALKNKQIQSLEADVQELEKLNLLQEEMKPDGYQKPTRDVNAPVSTMEAIKYADALNEIEELSKEGAAAMQTALTANLHPLLAQRELKKMAFEQEQERAVSLSVSTVTDP